MKDLKVCQIINNHQYPSGRLELSYSSVGKGATLAASLHVPVSMVVLSLEKNWGHIVSASLPFAPPKTWYLSLIVTLPAILGLQPARAVSLEIPEYLWSAPLIHRITF